MPSCLVRAVLKGMASPGCWICGEREVGVQALKSEVDRKWSTWSRLHPRRGGCSECKQVAASMPRSSSGTTEITMLIPCLAGWKSEQVGSDDNNSDFLFDVIERFRVRFYQGTIPKLPDYSQSHLNRNIYPGSRYAIKGYPSS